MTPVGDGIITGPLLGAIENKINYEFFFGRNIVPDWEKDLQLDARQGTQYASRLGRLGQKITESLGMGTDSRNIDHLIYTTAGGAGRLAMALSDIGREDRVGDEAARSVSGIVTVPPASSAVDVQWVDRRSKELGDEQSRTLEQFRTIRKLHAESTSLEERDRLAKQLRAEGTKLRDYYQTYAGVLLQAKKAANSIAAPEKYAKVLKSLNPQQAADYTARHQEDLDKLDAVRAQKRQMQTLRNGMADIMANPDLTDAERRQQLDDQAKQLREVADQILANQP